MEIPTSDVSTVFLASNESTKPAKATAPFRLRLPGDGSLAVSSCRFNSEEATAEHSLLGTLTLRPGSITAIERATTPPPAEP